ncbi:unnamed protein product [Discosporangium mesarthrocarpum]
MVMVLAAHEDWELFHWDVRQAFIHAKVKEDIYIRLCEVCGRCTGKVAKLVKSLYGCRHFSRNFCLVLSKCLGKLVSSNVRQTLVFYVLFLLGKFAL